MASSIAGFPLYAGNDTGATQQLPTVVVTATATERDERDVPASVSVITRDDLQRRPIQDLSDALRGTPGINVTGVGLTRRGIQMRGMDAEYTLTLVDGRRVSAASDAIAHADFDLGWIPVESIERIEVVRGPMSSLYGSEALGGVVNVITRRATDEWRGSLAYNGGSVSGGQGGNTTQFGVYAGGPLIADTLGLSVHAEHRQRGEIADRTDPRLSEQEGREAHSASATLTWTPGLAQRIDLSHLQGRETRERNVLQTGGIPYVYENGDRIEREHTSLAHTGEWHWGETSMRAYRSTLDRVNSRSQGTPTGPQHLRDDIADARASIPLGTRHRVSVGGEWRRERLQDNTVNNAGRAELTQHALFVQDEIELSGRWSLVVGNRSDRHPQYGWHHSPRAYAIHHLSDALTIRGGVGTGFKAPTLKQLSPEYSAIGGGGRFTIYGNPALKPEENTSWELGLAWSGGAHRAGITAFHNDLDNLIQTYCVSDCGIRGLERRNYTNVAEARIRGVEANAGIGFSPQWRLDANYTWLQPRDRTTGLPLVERPLHSGTVSLGWTPTGAWETRLRAEYKGEQWQASGTTQVKLPDYALWSWDVSYRVTDGIVLRGSIENLTDERHDEQLALYPYAETGRYINVGVTLGF